MKKQLFGAVFLLNIIMAAQASLYIQGSTGQGVANEGSILDATIVDGNPASITANTMDLTSAGLESLSSVTLTLNISGGMNNGLYGYLVAPNGGSVILMNQPGVGVDGFGATGAGMNVVTFLDGGSFSIQNVTGGGVLNGTYSADQSFSGLSGINPNGLWTLYLADTIAGGGDATLNGWSLDITAVPEPKNLTLAFFGMGAGILVLHRFIRARKPFTGR